MDAADMYSPRIGEDATEKTQQNPAGKPSSLYIVMQKETTYL